MTVNCDVGITSTNKICVGVHLENFVRETLVDAPNILGMYSANCRQAWGFSVHWLEVGLTGAVLWIRNYFLRIRIPFSAEFWIRILLD
jgi:hypothetical protein